ncbi:double-stranded RNA-binding protein 1-like [Trifolium pratense]|uniref:Double-stranded RNA-binding protein 1-like n=1 Tax=Trifolium pratense TaxID=57577 RepID=A0A2K3N591_TRIPR|nr:double-stranded RNA-binding protein 1-like [Trifolium pratense]
MYKKKLQELCQHKSWNLPEYETIREGPQHNSRFSTTVIVNSTPFTSTAQLRTIKLSQNDAAMLAFNHFSQQQNPTIGKPFLPNLSSFPQPVLSTSSTSSYSQDKTTSFAQIKARRDALATTLNVGEAGSDISNVPMVDLAKNPSGNDDVDVGVVHSIMEVKGVVMAANNQGVFEAPLGKRITDDLGHDGNQPQEPPSKRTKVDSDSRGGNEGLNVCSSRQVVVMGSGPTIGAPQPPLLLSGHSPKTVEELHSFFNPSDLEKLDQMSNVEQRKLMVESLPHVLRVVAMGGFMVSSGVSTNVVLYQEKESLKAEVERLKKEVGASQDVLHDALGRENDLKENLKVLKNEKDELLVRVNRFESTIKEHGKPCDLKIKLGVAERALSAMQRDLTEKSSLITSLKKDSVDKDVALFAKDSEIKGLRHTCHSLKKELTKSLNDSVNVGTEMFESAVLQVEHVKGIQISREEVHPGQAVKNGKLVPI